MPLINLAKIFALYESKIAFICLVVAQLEWPDTSNLLYRYVRKVPHAAL